MEQYDIFISVRNSDENDNPTPDTELAQSLYYALQRKGYNPFFSKICINGSGGSNYVSAIDDALEQAKVFVAVGTSKENLKSRWVKREIDIFTARMMRKNEEDLTLLSYRSVNFSVDELPVAFANLQSFDNQDALVRFIDVCLQKATGFHNYFGETTVLCGEQDYDTDVLAPQQENSTHASSQGLQIGQIVDGRYQILSEIGRGGVSRVFLALHKSLDKTFAIKEIRKDLGADLSFVLQNEINFLKRLDHHSFVRIIDAIENDGAIIIIMEYVEGQNLEKIISEYGAIKEATVFDIARQLALALDYLHTLSTPIIYRDMKPSNVILQPNGQVKILDFGTAREYKSQSIGDTVCLGTRGYAAPEQYGGSGQTDARTDIYALGMTLHYLLTGKSPTEPPYEIRPIREWNPELSCGFEYIIKKCTQLNPTDRFQSAKELLNALDNIDKLGKKTLASFFVKKKSKKSAPKKEKPSVPAIPSRIQTVSNNAVLPPVKPVAIPPVSVPVKPNSRPNAPVGVPQNNKAVSAETEILPVIKSVDVKANDTVQLTEIAQKLKTLDHHTRKIIIDLIELHSK